MNTQKVFKFEAGEVTLGFTLLDNKIHVKLLVAQLYHLPKYNNKIENIVLFRVSDTDHRLPVSKENNWEEFSKLVTHTVRQVDWKQVEVLLYDVQRKSVAEKLDTLRKQRHALNIEYRQTRAAKDQAEQEAKNGLLQKAASLLSSVIFRLT